jgi:hypothetical protein
MHALDSKTPYEALHGHLPDLSNLCIWGCQVWVHSASEAKLNVYACQACWLGFDLNAHTHCIYWPDSGSTTVECNVYFRLLVLLKGEEDDLVILNVGSEQPANPQPSSPEPLDGTVLNKV